MTKPNDLSTLRGEGRLVQRTLPDGGVVELVERSATVTGFDAETRAVEILASDASEDRYGDIIDAKGWILDQYEKNPVVLIDHRYTVDSIVGTAQVAATDAGLRASISLDDPAINYTAASVSRKLQSGSLRAVSVGFLPREYEWIRDAKGNPTGGIKFTKSELLEISFVPVPANPNAVLGNAIKAAEPAPAAPAIITAPQKDHDMDELQDIESRLKSATDTIQSHEEWFKKVEDDLARARRGNTVSDNLREAIPSRAYNTIDQHARAGSKDPVLAAAKDAWFRNAIKIASGMYNSEVSNLLEENARLAAAMGDVTDSVVTRATINENTATQGGNLVPTVIEAEIIRLIADNALVRPLARKITMTTKTHTVPSPTSVTAYVVAESGTDITAGEPQINTVTLTTKTFSAFGLVTYESLADSVVGIADMFENLAAQAFGATEDNLALEGTAGGTFVGLAGASGVTTLDATTATNASAVPTYTQIVKMIYNAKKHSSRRRGAFFFAPTAWANIAGQVSTSLPAFNGIPGFTALDPTGEADGRVGAYPVYCTEQIASDRTDVGGTDVSYGYFGDFQNMLFGDRTGMDFMISPHYKFQAGLIAMRLLKRTAITVGVPAGFCWMKKIKSS